MAAQKRQLFRLLQRQATQQLLSCPQRAWATPEAAHAQSHGSLLRQLATGTARRRASLTARLRLLALNYKQLSKAKLSALVVMTASAGYVAGSGEQINYAGLLWTSLGTFGAAACANALNQVYEVANDQRMSRTCNRPLPTGRLTQRHALLFALATGAAGVALLASQANWTTAALGAGNIALYAGIYTPLKQLSPVNTWVGALVGALPPLMGWAAASDGALPPGAWLLAGALFSWQMPHFMSLAWLCKDDYARGGFRMISLNDIAGRRTALVALRHCALLLPVGAAAVYLQLTSTAFAAEAAALAAFMGYRAVAFVQAPSQASARSLFRSSLLYLPLLLAALVVHRQPNAHAVTWAELQQQLQQQLQQLQQHIVDLGFAPAAPQLHVVIPASAPAAEAAQTTAASAAGCVSSTAHDRRQTASLSVGQQTPSPWGSPESAVPGFGLGGLLSLPYEKYVRFRQTVQRKTEVLNELTRSMKCPSRAYGDARPDDGCSPSPGGPGVCTDAELGALGDEDERMQHGSLLPSRAVVTRAPSWWDRYAAAHVPWPRKPPPSGRADDA